MTALAFLSDAAVPARILAAAAWGWVAEDPCFRDPLVAWDGDDTHPTDWGI